MDTDKIIGLHKELFETPDTKVANEVVINAYLESQDSINLGLEDSSIPFFDVCLRIKTAYCLALAELERLGELAEVLSSTIEQYDKIFKSDSEKMNVSFFEFLIFHRMRMFCENKKFESAETDIRFLIHHHPGKDPYPQWKSDIDGELKKEGFMGRIKMLFN